MVRTYTIEIEDEGTISYLAAITKRRVIRLLVSSKDGSKGKYLTNEIGLPGKWRICGGIAE